MPCSDSNSLTRDRSAISKSPSTEHCSAPVRIRVLSPVLPSKQFEGPQNDRLAGAVSPVTTVNRAPAPSPGTQPKPDCECEASAALAGTKSLCKGGAVVFSINARGHFSGNRNINGSAGDSLRMSVCHSPDPRDHRWRSSVYLQTPTASWVIDTGAEFRLQALRSRNRGARCRNIHTRSRRPRGRI